MKVEIVSDKKQPGAVPVLLTLILSIWFAIPNEISIAHIVIDFFAQNLCPNPDISFCDQIIIWKVLLNISGMVLVIGNIIYIYSQIKKGKIF